MKEKINILIFIFLILIVLISIFLIWQNYQKTERQYKACLEKCKASFNIFDQSSENSVCITECKEKYGK